MNQEISNPSPEANGSSPRPCFRDPAFMANRNAPVHRWVPWIAGFSQQFVDDALNRFMCKHGTVLDPFSGVGTTLIEADLAGHDAIGFEINPYALFAANTKLKSHRLNSADLHGTASQLRKYKSTTNGAEPRSKPPENFRTRSAFYSPKVMRKVLLVQDFIDQTRHNLIAKAVRLAFASTMVSYSNYSYEPSLGRKSSVGRPDIDDFPVMETIADKIDAMADDAAWYKTKRSKRRRKDGRVLQGSFLDRYSEIERGSVDLLVTSPPYLNNYHYNRNTRPHLYWLGFCQSPKDLKKLETMNFGTYWQNARELAVVGLEPSIRMDEINRTIEKIREQNPAKGIYGGHGWANYAALYFNDCLRFASGAKWCVRPGGTALVVIGNSILQGIPIPTDLYLAKIAETQGFDLVDIHVPRDTRVGNSIIESSIRVGKASKKARLYESIVELRRQ